MALFGEKYGKRVRVVQAGDYSVELCGGCHVQRTGLIGAFRVVQETGIGSGVRRIEAVTGREAYRLSEAREQVLETVATLLKTKPGELVGRVERVLDELREVRAELESATAHLNKNRARDLAQQVQDVQGVPVLSVALRDLAAEDLRGLVDQLRALLPPAVIALGSAVQGRVQWVVSVDVELHARGLHAGQLVKRLAELTGGGGGGRADLAQAGGKDVAALSAAVAATQGLVQAIATVGS